MNRVSQNKKLREDRKCPPHFLEACSGAMAPAWSPGSMVFSWAHDSHNATRVLMPKSGCAPQHCGVLLPWPCCPELQSRAGETWGALSCERPPWQHTPWREAVQVVQ